jgi:hypothetical protein
MLIIFKHPLSDKINLKENLNFIDWSSESLFLSTDSEQMFLAWIKTEGHLTDESEFILRFSSVFCASRALQKIFSLIRKVTVP